MSLRHRVTTLSLSIVLLASNAGPSLAKAPTGPQATLGGRSIPLRAIGRLHCHDSSYPTIRCFRTGAAAEHDVARYLWPRRGSGSPQVSGIQAVNYVRLYEDASYQGASIFLSQGYADLGTIGWNDRMTSFKTLNGGAGTFYMHTGPSGATYSFCCAQQVSNIGSTWNDQISAVSGSA